MSAWSSSPLPPQMFWPQAYGQNGISGMKGAMSMALYPSVFRAFGGAMGGLFGDPYGNAVRQAAQPQTLEQIQQSRAEQQRIAEDKANWEKQQRDAWWAKHNADMSAWKASSPGQQFLGGMGSDNRKAYELMMGLR